MGGGGGGESWEPVFWADPDDNAAGSAEPQTFVLLSRLRSVGAYFMAKSCPVEHCSCRIEQCHTPPAVLPPQNMLPPSTSSD